MGEDNEELPRREADPSGGNTIQQVEQRDDLEFPFFSVLLVSCVGVLWIAGFKFLLERDWPTLRFLDHTASGRSDTGVFVLVLIWISVGCLASVFLFFRAVKHYRSWRKFHSINFRGNNRDGKSKVYKNIATMLLLLLAGILEVIVESLWGKMLLVPIGGFIVSSMMIFFLLWRMKRNLSSTNPSSTSQNETERTVYFRDHIENCGGIDFDTSYWLSLWSLIGCFSLGSAALVFGRLISIRFNSWNDGLFSICNSAHAGIFLMSTVVFFIRMLKRRKTHRCVSFMSTAGIMGSAIRKAVMGNDNMLHDDNGSENSNNDSNRNISCNNFGTWEFDAENVGSLTVIDEIDAENSLRNAEGSIRDRIRPTFQRSKSEKNLDTPSTPGDAAANDGSGDDTSSKNSLDNDMDRSIFEMIEIFNKDLLLLIVLSAFGYPIIVVIDINSPRISMMTFLGFAILSAIIWWLITSPQRLISNRADHSGERESRHFPENTYSFLAAYSWQRHHNLFCFGLVVFLFQALLTLCMILSAFFPRWRSGDIDNPASEESMWAFFPANATMLVRTTQFISIFCFMLFPEETLTDVTESVKLYPRGHQQGDQKLTGLAISCALRFTQGMLAIVAVFFLVMTSANVNEIILNFTAINFISKMDEVGFQLAESGYYGQAIKKAAKVIKVTEIPNYRYSKSLARKRESRAVAAVGSLLLIATVVVNAMQTNRYVWTTQTVRVQFNKKVADKSLSVYNGCYKIDNNSNTFDQRRLYSSHEQNEATATIGYCRAERRWLLFEGGGEITPCEAMDNEAEIARSPKSDFFDIDESTEEQWLNPLNAPIGLTFIQGENLDDGCDSFLDDEKGICDTVFNSPRYDYDGGDCCSFSCEGESCGIVIEGLEREVAYPDCVLREGLVPVTIFLKTAITNRTIHDGNSTADANIYTLDGASESQTVNPNEYLVELECNERTVFRTSMNEDLKEPATVNVGAKCAFFFSDFNGVEEDTSGLPRFVYYVSSRNASLISDDGSLIHEGIVRTNATKEYFYIYN